MMNLTAACWVIKMVNARNIGVSNQQVSAYAAEPRALRCEPLKAAYGRLLPHLQLVQSLVLDLLVADVFAYRFLVASHGRHKITSCPELLPGKILLGLSERPGQMNRA